MAESLRPSAVPAARCSASSAHGSSGALSNTWRNRAWASSRRLSCRRASADRNSSAGRRGDRVPRSRTAATAASACAGRPCSSSIVASSRDACAASGFGGVGRQLREQAPRIVRAAEPLEGPGTSQPRLAFQGTARNSALQRGQRLDGVARPARRQLDRADLEPGAVDPFAVRLSGPDRGTGGPPGRGHRRRPGSEQVRNGRDRRAVHGDDPPATVRKRPAPPASRSGRIGRRPGRSRPSRAPDDRTGPR